MNDVSNPFPGLRPFKFHEHELFFGREEQYEQMVAKLSAARFLAVVGTSGSGKSSLVRAGLQPALYSGLMMSAGCNWRMAVFRPKDDPIRELALALNHHRVFGSKFSENGASLLKVGDILDWPAFCSRLRDEAAKSLPSPSRRMVELLPSEVGQVIRESNGNGFNETQKDLLISEFNQILKRRDFYEPQAFEKVAIKSEASSLLERGPSTLSDSEVLRLNRLMLEAHYSIELAKKGDIQTKITEVTLRRGDLGLVEAVRQLKMSPQENLLVIVDQFEELFRYARISENGPHGNQAAAFVKLLLEARNQSEIPIYVVLTMRSDYLGDCAKFWDLPEAINEGEYLIPRLTREQRREAIRGPIKLRRAEITPQLVNQLLNDMGDSPDELPILQHALMRTWNHWTAHHKHGEPIDVSHYNAIGRMSQALSLHADEAYESVPHENRKLTEKIFRCLTERASGERETRRPASLRELRAVTGAPTKQIASVIDVFRRPDRSFLMPSARKPLRRGNSIDISHESLIRNWTKLKHWVDQEATAANTYRRLVETARLHKKQQAGLLSALEVEYALKWCERNKPNAAWASRYHMDLDDTQRLYANVTSDQERKACDKKIFDQAMAFLETSRRAQVRANEEKKRQSRSQLRRLQAIAAIFVLATIICFVFFKKAQNEERLANLLTYVENLNSVRSELDRKNFGRAYELLNTLTVSNYKDLRGFELQFLARPSPSLLEPKLGHDDSVLAVAFLPRKNLLASVTADGKVKLWQPTSWKVAEWQKDSWVATDLLLKEPDDSSRTRTSNNPVSLVAFSPDGESFATFDSKSLKFWHINNEGSAAELVGESKAMDKGVVVSIAFSADGKSVASAISRNGKSQKDSKNSIELWDASTGDSLMEEPTAADRTLALAFSVDGNLAIGNADGRVELRDPRTLKEKSMLSEDTGGANKTSYKELDDRSAVEAMAFSPDGKLLAIGTSKGNIELEPLDTTAQKPVSFPAHSYPISQMVFSADGQTLASASLDGSVKLWKTNDVLHNNPAEATIDRDRPLMLTGHAGPIHGIAFVANTNLLVTASGDKTARLWDTGIPNESSLVQFCTGLDERVSSVAFTPDARTLAVAFSPNEKTQSEAGEDGEVKFLDPVTMREKALLGNTKVAYFAVSSTRELLATWKSDGSLTLWDSHEGKQLATIEAASREVKAMAFSKTGNDLAIWSLVDGATIYDTTSKLAKSRKVENLQHTGQVSSVAFSPDLETFAVGLENGLVEIFSTRNGLPPRPLVGHSATVLSIAFSRDGQRLATGSADKTVRLWNTRTWKDSVPLVGHEMPVQSLAFSDDGTRLASGCWDGTVKLWDADIKNNVDLWNRLKRQELATLRVPRNNPVLALAFSHDGATLASADSGNIVNLWKTTNHRN